MSLTGKTLVRVKRRRDQPPLEAILVKDGSATKRAKLHEAFARTSLQDDSKAEQVFHFVSSVPEKDLEEEKASVLEKVSKFSIELKKRSTEYFSSGDKRRNQLRKNAEKHRSLQRLKQIDVVRQSTSSAAKKSNFDANNDSQSTSSCKNSNDKSGDIHNSCDKETSGGKNVVIDNEHVNIVDVSMVDDEILSPENDQEKIANSLLDSIEKSKESEVREDEEKRKEDLDDDEYVYDYFCTNSANDLKESSFDLEDYLDSLFRTNPSAVTTPRLGNLYLTFPGEGQSDDDDLENFFGQESDVDGEDSNREHSDYPDEEYNSDGSYDELYDYVDEQLHDDFHDSRSSQIRHDRFLRDNANTLAYDSELDGELSDGYHDEIHDEDMG